MLFQFVLLKLYRENNENKQKEAGISPFKKEVFFDQSERLKNNRSKKGLATGLKDIGPK